MTPQAAALLRQLPEELRNARQWCIAGPDRAPYVVSGGTVKHGSIHKPEEWKSLEEVIADALKLDGAGVGFMLSYADPWTVIDLDVKNEHTQRAKGEAIDPSKWTSQEVIDGYMRAVQKFDTYTEISSGGYGLHIWCRGAIGLGARRGGVEVYSQERFIVCTGNVYVNKPIADRQELLEQTVDEIRAQGSDIRAELEELEEEDSDMEVWERAANAANGEKFKALCEGKWQGDYPSQSEADLALMSMLAFYSKSNEQCRRIFRCTALGQRDKATKNNRYLNFTLEVIRGRQKRESMADMRARELAAEYVRELTGGSNQADVSAAQIATTEVPRPDIDSTLSWPPGLAGAIASFIYTSAPRPVKEVAIVAALGLLAGVCGKAFSLPQSGLNIYTILVARSGVGKEAMHSGLALILEELRNSIPAAQRFVDFTEYASGPALRKACSMNQSFVNVSGEWGRRLKRLAYEDKPDGPMATLRTAMTDLYQKSGPASLVGGIGYSDKDKNVGTVSGVAYSMIGETTPGTFYESLTQTMMEDGFLSRFIIIDYNGDRPPLNTARDVRMHPALAQALHGLCAHALTLLSRFANERVQVGEDAQGMLNAFDMECDNEINGTDDESVRQMWNRAHLKAMRIAALLAVADNWLAPVIHHAHAQWALEVVRRDISIMSVKLQAGEIGQDDASRERKMVATLRSYIQEGAKSEAYGCPESLRKAGIVPHRYLQIRLSRVSAFMSSRNGATKSIADTIRALCESGYLADADKNYLSEKHGYFGRAYRIISLPPLK